MQVVVSASRKPSDGKSYRGSLPSGVSAASADGDWLHVSLELDSPTAPHQVGKSTSAPPAPPPQPAS